MPKLVHQLEVDRCPHCGVSKPVIVAMTQLIGTQTHSGYNKRLWIMYKCTTCGGAIIAASTQKSGSIIEMYPEPKKVDEAISERAKKYLRQAIDTIHAPCGSIMLCASSVDAMLKEKGYKKGSLYDRINKATEDHLITEDMSKWAHEVRLDANDQRHSDEEVPLPSEDDAQRCVDFVISLADLLFVLPARVQRGLEDAQNE